MTTLLALLNSGGNDIVTDAGTYWQPYFIGGGILLGLGLVMAALLAFGKGREHS